MGDCCAGVLANRSDEMVSSAVLVEGPLRWWFPSPMRRFFVGMVGLIEAGSELPADLLDSECVS